jgi:hypothetical protein
MPEGTTTTTQPGATGATQGETQAAQQATWENVLEGLPEEQRTLYTAHTQGLRSALESERDQRKQFEKQLRELAGQAQKGSQLETQLATLTTQLDEANRRADFVTEATGQGVVNARLAWLAAQEAQVFDRKGNVDWAALKQRYPELFRQQQATSPGNAGAGTNQQPSGPAGMTQIIRRAAGRQQ